VPSSSSSLARHASSTAHTSPLTPSAPPGSLAAYLTPDPLDKAQHPAIIWIAGGDCNSIGDVWSPMSPSNDQNATAYRLAGIVLDPVAAPRKMTKLGGDAAGQATKTDRILVMGATETGRRRALAGAGMPVRWDGPGDGASGTLRT
jgi:hypothetical protein